MARAAGKKQSKPAAQSTHSQVTAAPASTSSSIPEDFKPLPASLRPLASTLPTDHVYTVHVDTSEPELKKRVFIVPLLMNLIIVMALIIRAIYAAPVYLDQIITIFGYETAWKVQPDRMEFGDIAGTIAERTGLLMIDYAIFGFIGSWPKEFFFGSRWTRRTGPLDWRRKIGFRDTEIIVRRGRKWDTPLFAGESKIWTREEELTMRTHVIPAMSRTYTSKTGYLLLDKFYDLDFKAMIDAHRLVEKGRLDLKDLDHIVLIYYKDQWLVWKIQDETEAAMDRMEADSLVDNFRSKLVELGREDVFFRWIEIVQYETSLPEGFTQVRQSEAVQELKKLLTDQGVDVAKFWEDIGGQKGVVGLTALA